MNQGVTFTNLCFCARSRPMRTACVRVQMKLLQIYILICMYIEGYLFWTQATRTHTHILTVFLLILQTDLYVHFGSIYMFFFFISSRQYEVLFFFLCFHFILLREQHAHTVANFFRILFFLLYSSFCLLDACARASIHFFLNISFFLFLYTHLFLLR